VPVNRDVVTTSMAAPARWATPSLSRTAVVSGGSLDRRVGPSGPDEVREEEAEIRRALGEAPDEVAVPVLAEGHEHAEPDPQAEKHLVEVRADAVEHLELADLGIRGVPGSGHA
jgi:hypothetical protein